MLPSMLLVYPILSKEKTKWRPNLKQKKGIQDCVPEKDASPKGDILTSRPFYYFSCFSSFPNHSSQLLSASYMIRIRDDERLVMGGTECGFRRSRRCINIILRSFVIHAVLIFLRLPSAVVAAFLISSMSRQTLPLALAQGSGGWRVKSDEGENRGNKQATESMSRREQCALHATSFLALLIVKIQLTYLSIFKIRNKSSLSTDGIKR